MAFFDYKNNVLHAEDVSLSALADLYGTPFYCYSYGALASSYDDYARAFADYPGEFRLCFSVKSNSNQAILASLASMGAGADCVSEGEIRRALAAGVAPRSVVFAGVGKTDAELAFALDVGIFMFNVESESELYRLNRIATEKNARALVAFRVNPDVDAGTHHKISTGRKRDKFGVAYDDAERLYAEASKMEGVDPFGVDMHIGSQLTSLEPFRLAFDKLAELVLRLRASGRRIEHIDIGGGLGVSYGIGKMPPSIDDYADLAIKILGKLNCSLTIEPGRSIVANAGVLVARAVAVKKAGDAHFLIVDAAMNDLIRPSFYDAYHDILPVRRHDERRVLPQDVVGPICETGDIFASGRPMQEIKPGECVAISGSGAYGAVMGSNYNTRVFPPELLTRGSDAFVVRPRQTYDEIIGKDVVPPWIVSAAS
ncbi:MAG: diaminopimelate decarboxylase [Rickettsiales bacterium]